MLDPQFKGIKLPRSVAISAEEYLHEGFIAKRQELDKQGSAKREKRAQPKTRPEHKEKRRANAFVMRVKKKGEDNDEAELRRYLAQDRALFDYKTEDYGQAHKAMFPALYTEWPKTIYL